MLEILVRQPPRADDADNPIRLCYTGPSPDREHQLEIEERFGFEIVCGYALSESPYALIWRHGERPYGTLGSARQHPMLGHVNDARAVDDGRVVGPGEDGELELRNPAIMRGYYEMPEETAAVIVDGWLRTGDLVRVNADETYTFLGRKKEVIRRRGENLSPAEVEAALERHPDVAEAAVIGVPSDLSEEDVKAFVVAAPGRTPDLAALHAFAREHLAALKVPRYIEVVAELPHTATDRLAKHQLPRERTPAEVDFEAPTRAVSGLMARTTRPPTGRARGSAARRATAITVAGRDLPAEIMGQLTLTELAYLLVTKREPTPQQTPAARRGARVARRPRAHAERARGAAHLHRRARGDPGRGRGRAARRRAACSSARPATPRSSCSTRCRRHDGRRPTTRRSRGIAERRGRRVPRARATRVPGLGHPVHKDVDPRTPRLYAIAAEEGLLGPHLRLLEHVAAVNEERSGKHLPVNGAGAGGAALVDLGLPPSSARGVVLIARTAGLVAHLVEEAEQPVGMPLWLEVERRAGAD